ncbi:hypothetical protein HC251_03190 [Iamia sp. SCSIO 61187]|uniref:hypothetical protein n=1 Tax=Iamia sp. SCSIO 61187 TaxID=2722752 RepID=UPI001C626068|nr:hypothetical protein [Iamia sp. SCSIO 61187]QYG91540.1 hypothetical protein HC251_03190 [Iamia sp. SCSIO 61187]
MSRPTPTRPRPTRARAAGLFLVAAVALGACSHQRDIPDAYGDTTEGNFIEGCEVALTDDDGAGPAFSDDDAQAVCECSYEDISNPETGIPYEDFREINDELEQEPGPLPEAIRDLVQTCVDENLS